MNLLKCIDIPSNIPGIDYDLINKLKLLNNDLINESNLKLIKSYNTNELDSSDTDEIGKQLKNSNTNELDSSDTDEISKQLKNNNSLDLDNSESNFDRLIPPYIIECEYNKIDGCIKKSAFTYSNKYYCWFHNNCINCSN